MRKWQSILGSAAIATMLFTPFAEASTYYKVEKGDTLSKIAAKHSTTVALLKEWNRLQDDRIYVDQKLIVSEKQVVTSSPNLPTSTVTNIETNKKPSTDASKDYTYIVVQGDNLTKIATKNNTTVDKLKEWNGLTSDAIFVNQTLIIRQGGQALNNSVASKNSPTVGIQQPNTTSVDVEIAKKLDSEEKITKSPSAPSLEKYNKAVELAYSLLGTPYVYGGNSVKGFDCSGFINYIYTNAGVDITRKSSLDYFMNDTVVVDNPVPGDVVFFKNTYISTISHMGIYIGDNQFIHAGTAGVEISNLSYEYWDTRYVASKRFNVVK